MKEWTRDNTSEFAVMTRQQVREFDAWAIGQMGIPGIVLMENAAREAAEVILRLWPKERVCIFCGGGNNGGDGFAIARHLYNHGISVQLAVCADPARIKGDARINYDICRALKLPMEVLDILSADMQQGVQKAAESYGLLVDALLGTGMQGELADSMIRLISVLNACGRPIAAVDIPSGLDCDTGLPLPVCIEAAATITFAAIKKGFTVCPQSRQATGRVFVADIGIVPASIRATDSY
ncbi:MAG TPA: NAD(P)H-hydrate epimerase [Anaerohalosphaeraceae bacterium]|nr:NAD(P)H-hydrate epimerase [Phycisphaerae bacterium]HOK96340.1 NAD(P)H-hydrate epimerase [Anaerohalosphaeraceae bacterium]HOL30641.1 NAD(P)H-hydrate epimerase [Anaerohalosphaeraceae bacterium]HOM75935.1 NAD(P)H-hydrate epimerase [Anaerohalosphaeraceae bacterium]HPC65061.1 NAD(P)H-hydrate epimerase [Anaerohalosphaeraceae bacterium]